MAFATANSDNPKAQLAHHDSSGASTTSSSLGGYYNNLTQKTKLILPTALWVLLIFSGICFLGLLMSLNRSLTALDELVKVEGRETQKAYADLISALHQKQIQKDNEDDKHYKAPTLVHRDESSAKKKKVQSSRQMKPADLGKLFGDDGTIVKVIDLDDPNSNYKPTDHLMQNKQSKVTKTDDALDELDDSIARLFSMMTKMTPGLQNPDFQSHITFGKPMYLDGQPRIREIFEGPIPRENDSSRDANIASLIMS